MKGHSLPGISQKGNKTTKGASPAKKALVGEQGNLPEELKAKIKASPAKGFLGNLAKGKGALGALNPLGAIGSKMGMF
tara:strand:+ start:1677 stop:1910 length:234 start_codon:yes stop_codon:yes gene_type:complete